MHIFEISIFLLLSSSTWLVRGFVLNDLHRNETKVLTVQNGAIWGDWAVVEFCSPGTFAVGFDLKIESFQFGGDDTELNGIKLFCEPEHDQYPQSSASSGVSGWGSWQGLTMCNDNPPNGTNDKTFLKSFELKAEANQGSGDDTGATNIKFHCQDFESRETPYELYHGSTIFGSYGRWSDTCGPSTAICGIQTKIERSLGNGDDTALDDVKMFCCSYSQR